MVRSSLLLLLVLCAVTVAGCERAVDAEAAPSSRAPQGEGEGEGEDEDGGDWTIDPGEEGETETDVDVDVDGGEGEPASDGGEGEGEGEESDGGGAAGNVNGGTGTRALTAGAWDDNLNYDVFSSWYALAAQGSSAVPPLSSAEQQQARDRAAQRVPHARLDVALVVDVTGSMSDELRYLQGEFDAIVADLDASWPDADARWALVLYRDGGDDFVTRATDFTTATRVRSALASVAADGGGDLPEAVADALEETAALSWRADADVARMAFWVADAPHHERDTQRVTSALRDAAAIDVHLYPVAASGTDGLTEIVMRAAAQLTGGRYLFLTDDSGVGNAHAEPSIPCYFVTTLGNAVVRMVDIEMSGAWREPAADEVLRTGGDPQDGHCVLHDGREVWIF